MPVIMYNPHIHNPSVVLMISYLPIPQLNITFFLMKIHKQLPNIIISLFLLHNSYFIDICLCSTSELLVLVNSELTGTVSVSTH